MGRGSTSNLILNLGLDWPTEIYSNQSLKQPILRGTWILSVSHKPSSSLDTPWSGVRSLVSPREGNVDPPSPPQGFGKKSKGRCSSLARGGAGRESAELVILPSLLPSFHFLFAERPRESQTTSASECHATSRRITVLLGFCKRASESERERGRDKERGKKWPTKRRTVRYPLELAGKQYWSKTLI